MQKSPSSLCTQYILNNTLIAKSSGAINSQFSYSLHIRPFKGTYPFHPTGQLTDRCNISAPF